jgi:hypothetical protein
LVLAKVLFGSSGSVPELLPFQFKNECYQRAH